MAQIDRLAADPDAKLQIIQLMAVDLGTHRNHLIFLKKQSQESFGQIYVNEPRKRGLDDDAILKKLHLIESPLDGRPQAELSATGFRPIAYLGTTADHNSAGTLVSISPEIGIDSRHFAFVVGLPIYRVSATQHTGIGIGDAYSSVFVRQPRNRDEGLGASRVSINMNGTVQRRCTVGPWIEPGDVLAQTHDLCRPSAGSREQVDPQPTMPPVRMAPRSVWLREWSGPMKCARPGSF